MGTWLREGFTDPAVVAELPQALLPFAAAAERIRLDDHPLFSPIDETGRHSAILMLLSADPEPALLMIRRADDMRAHAGQPALPGGAVDPGDAGAIGAALREAEEETGLDPGGVRVFGQLPDLWLSFSGFVVSPVLGWWQTPSPVAPQDPAEVALVTSVRVADLVDPINRVRTRHPSGYVGPAFAVNDMLVWGFTAGLIDLVLREAGLEVPWDLERYVDLQLPGDRS